ncbi:MAG TPA: hypothetical protein VIV60_00320, partial [Polyangiaceae bacterium]
MRHRRLVQVSLALGLALGCARQEPSLVPLGHGPLSQKERAIDKPLPNPVRLSSEAPSDAPASSTDVDEATVTVLPSEGSLPTARERNGSTQSTDMIAAAGTVNAPTSDGRTDEWLGMYRGDDTTIFKMPDQPDRRFDDAKASILVESATDSKLSFHLVDSSNGKDICSLSATVEGSVASIE